MGDIELDLLFNFGGHSMTPLAIVREQSVPLLFHRSRGKSCWREADEGRDSYFGFYFGTGEAASFWKRGSFRSGSNMGSSRSSAEVSGMFEASGPSYGLESSFCNAAMARSGSPIRAATRARISIGAGPAFASFSTGIAATA